MKVINDYHSLSIEEVLIELGTRKEGLTDKEVRTKQEEYGINEIGEKKRQSPLILFLHQFKSTLIYILAVAGLIAYFMNHFLDTYLIGAVILINATIGFIQEYRAEKSIKSLKKMIIAKCRVYRKGELLETEAKNLVPGDIILLEEGDKVPADARLIEVKNLRTNEASLTGESMPVEKKMVILSKTISLSDRKNCVWMGTFVVGGKGKAVVMSTGKETIIGKIAQDIEQIKRGKTHFERKTDKLAKQMAILALVGAITIFLIGLFKENYGLADMFVFSIASLVSAIPAGLPAVLIIVLAAGANRMARKNAIIRSLPATETLSITNIIATDKTGTLTQNTMTVKKIVTNLGEIEVSGEGWVPKGKFFKDNKVINLKNYKEAIKLIKIGLSCSGARLVKENEKTDNYEIKGDPTEGAMTVLAYKAEIDNWGKTSKLIDELPFDQEMKIKAVLIKEGGKKEIMVSGAPENLIKFCTKIRKKGKIVRIKEEDKEKMMEAIKQMSNKAMRVIAFGYRTIDKESGYISSKMIKKLILVGVVGMIDPPRLGVKEAIIKAKKAGIRIIMKTGDHKNTALAMAKEIGMVDKNENRVIDGAELFAMKRNEFVKTLEEVNVYARLTPKMKLNILEHLQSRGNFVAMIGDGVNDALALKKADIGIAMGIRGTDVARESADMVLADDNFSSLIDAVEEGRIVYTNTKQASAFLVTTNFAEQTMIILSIILGLPLPFVATQILWLNLVTDGVADVSLAVEPGHGDVLDQSPRSEKENILSKNMIAFMFWIVLIMVTITMITFVKLLPYGTEKARTGAFLAMALANLFNILNMRSLELSLFKIGLWSNKLIVGAISLSLILQTMAMKNNFLKTVLRFESLSSKEVIWITILSSSVLWGGELYKFIKNKWKK